MNTSAQKPVIGITVGDINGIGPELIIKAFSDPRVLELCTPVIFGSNKILNFYRRSGADNPFNYQIIRDLNRIVPRQINIVNSWEEEVVITPGQLNETGGKYAVRSLT